MRIPDRSLSNFLNATQKKIIIITWFVWNYEDQQRWVTNRPSSIIYNGKGKVEEGHYIYIFFLPQTFFFYTAPRGKLKTFFQQTVYPVTWYQIQNTVGINSTRCRQLTTSYYPFITSSSAASRRCHIRIDTCRLHTSRGRFIPCES